MVRVQNITILGEHNTTDPRDKLSSFLWKGRLCSVVKGSKYYSRFKILLSRKENTEITLGFIILQYITLVSTITSSIAVYG